MKNSKLYYIHCLSPVHVGSGEGLGVIDMPIVREKATQWPYLPGSGLKGVQREYFKNENEEFLAAAFGKASNGDNDLGNAGALVLSDARMLAFPVASRYGTFAYVSCPLALKRMQRDMAAAKLQMPELDWERLDESLSGGDSAYTIHGNAITRGGYVELDEFTCPAMEDPLLLNWLEWFAPQLFTNPLSGSLFKERFVLVSDEAFQYFVTHCCELTPRIRLSTESKTTEDGALWYEEYLPTETVLYGLVWSDKIHVRNSTLTEQDLLNRLSGEQLLQVGGNATIGKGRVHCMFSEGESL